MSLISIQSAIRNYTLDFVDSFDFLDGLEKQKPCVFVIDQNVWHLYSNGPLGALDPSGVIVVPIDEKLKSIESVQAIYDNLVTRTAKRNLTLISIGGGILQDISGFAASTLYRGINWVFVPTTLLAQADSCIGGKTSLNYGPFKNLIGTFYPPSHIVVCPAFLATQEQQDFFSGLGEVVKLHLIGGLKDMRRLIEALPAILRRDSKALFDAIRDSIMIKRGYIMEDEFDTGKRNMLNFGHCFGHAIESAAQYEIPHGQAVVLGMLLANAVAKKRGFLSHSSDQFITNELLLPSLVVKVKKDHLNPKAIIEAMGKDKKRTEKGLALVMMGDDNQMYRVNDLSEQEASTALESVSAQVTLQ